MDRSADRLVDQEIRETARRYRTIEIQAGQHVIAAADPLPDDLRQALDAISCANGSVHSIPDGSRFSWRVAGSAR